MDSNTEKKQSPKKEKSVLKALLSLLLKLLIIALLIYAGLTFVFGVYRLSGNNMYPALKDGDLCITYKLSDYYSSDVVAYNAGGEIRFGRIIARQGDTVDGDEEGLLLNGSHISEEIFYSTNMQGTVLELPVKLNEGEYIVLNDHREEESDSRAFGVITQDMLEGKIIFIFRRRGF